jgi:YrbI family 3-deoxy-D-manno-octulosonate 8-phosphate phosphatase
MMNKTDEKNVIWPAVLELIVFDFDGVMTDNSVYLTADGTEMVRCNRSDGWGIDQLNRMGFPMFVLSTEGNPVLRARCEKLKLPVMHGLARKEETLNEIIAERNIRAESVAYVGNDENDLGCLKLVGLPVVVADAHPSVLEVAELVLKKNGGNGAVREFCDMIIEQFDKKSH